MCAARIVTKTEPWKRFLEDEQAKLAGEIHWNNHLIEACLQHDVLTDREEKDLRGRLPEHQGFKFISFLREKTEIEFAEFAKILYCKRYQNLAKQMLNMTKESESRRRDLKERLKPALMHTRLSENDKARITTKVMDYMQSYTYEWEVNTQKLELAVGKMDEDIDAITKQIIAEVNGNGSDQVIIDIHEKPMQRLDDCVKSISSTCQKLKKDKQRLIEVTQMLEREKVDLNQSLRETIEDLDQQKQKVVDIRKELEQLKQEKRANTKKIEELQKILWKKESEVEENILKLKELELKEEEIFGKDVENAELREALRRKDGDLEEMRRKLEESEKKNDRLKGELEVQKRKADSKYK